ncbi:MAG: hypothetical protein ACI9JZ_002413 [Lentimonas sp.]|jgi:hypothetical protein
MSRGLTYQAISYPDSGFRKYFRGAFLKSHINRVLKQRRIDCEDGWACYEKTVWSTLLEYFKVKYGYINSYFIPEDPLTLILEVSETNDFSFEEFLMFVEDKFELTVSIDAKIDKMTLGELVIYLTEKQKTG